MTRSNTQPAHHRVELGLLGLLACLWGSSYLLISIAVTTIPPLTLIAGRVAMAACLLLLMMRVRQQRLPRDWPTWQRLFVQACCNSIFAWTLLAWGQQYVDSGLAGVLNSTAPLLVALAGFILAGQAAPTPWQVGGVLLGMGGVLLVVGAESLYRFDSSLLPQLAVLLSAALYAGAALHGHRLAHLPPLTVAAGTMVWATLCLVPLSLLLEQPWTLRPAVPSLLAAAGLGIFCTGIALLLYFRLVVTLGALGVASQSYLRAGVSVLLGVIVLGEQLTLPIGLGLGAVIAGVAAINRHSRP